MFSIIKKHGVKYQFGSSPGVECQDGTSTIKTLLHTRHNHDLPTYVEFVDLVKAFDTVDHTLMLQILKKYGAPPKLCSSITRMYQDLKVVLKAITMRRNNTGAIQFSLSYPDILTHCLLSFPNLENDF